jgi:heterodisulfide reductase subunit A-like polyferredoxin
MQSENIISMVLSSALAHRVCTRLPSAGACAEAGLNPYMCEIANLREHVSWVHEKGEATTQKAIEIVTGLVEKVQRNKPLNAIKVPITKNVHW